MTTQHEIRERISNEIVAALEKGVRPWKRPWSTGGVGLPVNAVSQRRYSGVNVLLLQLHQSRHGLRSSAYATFNQWRDLGYRVKPRPQGVPSGKWGCAIVYCRPVKKVEEDEKGQEQKSEYLLLRSYTVFSADQVEGDVARRIQAGDEIRKTPFADFAPAEDAVAATGADIRHGGDKAFYRRPTLEGDGDYVQMPHKRQFDDEKEYYATLLHEVAGHWTEHRLGWCGSYAAGELRAEMASCFAMAELGVPNGGDLMSHTAYLDHWLKAMREDPRFIFRASADASRAVDHFLALSRKAEPEPDDLVAV